MKKKGRSSGGNHTKQITNKRAKFDYDLGDNFIVGLVLNGRETKALRHGQGNLRGAFVTVKENELWLTNATITGGRGIPIAEEDQTRPRKLLAKKREISTMLAAKHQGNTLIPTDLLTQGRYIKLKVSIAKGKKLYDKRQTIKARDTSRDLDRELKR